MRHDADHKFWAAVKKYRAMPPERVETQAEKEARGRVFRPACEAHYYKACVHFVGFRGDEYVRAQRIWGKPDFIHRNWDERVMGDVDEGIDVVIFAKGDETWRKNPFTFNDSEHF